MNADSFRYFFNYHFSENRKLWDQYILPLSHEQFINKTEYSVRSVRKQIIHLISVDDSWFSELRDVEPLKPVPNVRKTDDRQLIRTHWDKVEQRMRLFLEELQDKELFEKPIKEPEEDKDLTVWQVFLQVVNHGTDHRAQLLRQLHDLGVRTTSQDFIFHVYKNK